MNLATAAMIISFQIGAVVPPSSVPADQPLAELARQERSRREAEGLRAAGAITSENVRRVGIPVVVGRVGQVVPGAPGTATGPQDGRGDEATAVSDDTDENPQEALAAQRRLVQSLEDEQVSLQLEINRWRARFQAPVVSQREQAQAMEGMEGAQAQLENVRAELAEAIAELQRLEQAVGEASAGGP